MKDLEELKLDIIIVTERKKNELETIDGSVHFYSGVPKEKRVKRKVSIVLKRKFSRSVTD
jgi:hypothetical protein